MYLQGETAPGQAQADPLHQHRREDGLVRPRSQNAHPGNQ